VKLVGETGRSLKRIADQVVEINGVVADIAVGAQEQATSLQHISAAVEQMNLATQESAAMVEESAAVGHSLSDESVKLAQLVGQFRIGRSQSEDRLRAELMKAAPHAFRAPSAGVQAVRAAAAGGDGQH
jgi:methyl-accepting chemotaxis protein